MIIGISMIMLKRIIKKSGYTPLLPPIVSVVILSYYHKKVNFFPKLLELG